VAFLPRDKVALIVNRYLMMIMALALAGAAVLTSSPAGARTLAGVTRAGGGWGQAEEVPGTAALNSGGTAKVASMSCASAGNCTAGGSYLGAGGTQPFVISQVNGTWGTAAKIPGMAKLNLFGTAEVTSVSCASAGNCTAGGYYQDGNTGSEQEAFVDSQVNGTWGKAEEVPGTAGLNAFGGVAAVTSVSCASAGNCSAGGYYDDPSFRTQAFVDSQVNGIWGQAEEVPGTPVPHQPGADIVSLSCASAGNCTAGGDTLGGSSSDPAFVVGQVNGTWGTAKKVPGLASTGDVASVSCASAGNCSAGGSYTDSSGHTHAFVVSQVNGTWGTAEQVPGTPKPGALNTEVLSVSCASAGNCGAGGAYNNSSGGQVFVVSQVNGTWGTAKRIRGIAEPNQGNTAIDTLSCASAGNCSAGGSYTDSSGHQQAFVVSQVNGTWGTAEQVPGTAALNKGNAAVIESVSCASAGSCSAGGSYTDSSGNRQAFVVSRS
jgi:hypothetical protein